MRKKRRCYFCDTIFQIFTCIHIELNEKNCADIYIVDTIKNSDKLCQQLKASNLFYDVIIINYNNIIRPIKNKILLKIFVFKAYLQKDKIVQSFIKSNDYDEMFYPDNNLCNRLVKIYLSKTKTVFICYDEGIGSYTGQFDKSNLFDKIFYNRLRTIKSDLYLYQPQLNQIEGKNIKQLVDFNHIDYANVSVYNRIFGYNQFGLSQNCIFFDSIREELFKNEIAMSQMQLWYNHIENVIGYKNLLLKSHPRARNKYPHKCSDYPIFNVPMEVECLNMNLDNICFITVASTAVVTPKIIFNKEPFVLLLCCLNKNVYEVDANHLNYFMQVKSLYKDQTKFMIPQDEKELDICLQSIKARNKE